eukprot:Sspe_Gene.117540::Locus_109054_Transcript_1_1_Confidence_1.000_Length_932::g.117540::m.117540
MRTPFLLLPLLYLPVAAAFQNGVIDMREFARDECTSSTKPPHNAYNDFCHQYSHTCCLQGADERAHIMFANLMDLGLHCSYAKTDIIEQYRELREWFCLACDPMEPEYRFRTALGDPANNIPPIVDSPHVFTWRICKSFVRRMWGGDGKRYDTCGVKTENPCSDGKQVASFPSGVALSQKRMLTGWNPYQCGDNLVIPSKFYQGHWEQAATEFLAALPPPNFEDAGFRFVVVDDAVGTNFDRKLTPCFGGTAAHSVFMMTLLLPVLASL